MKKTIALFLAFTMAAGALAGCARSAKPEPEESQPEESAYVYTNGEYKARYSVPALDRTLDFMTITVENDVITIKDYGMKEMESGSASSDSSSGESSEAASSESSAADSSAASGDASATEHEVNAAEAAKSILDEYNAVGGDVEKMEIVDGSEEHFYRFQRMMRALLSRAEKGEPSEFLLGKYADGDYESTMPSPNADGWTEFLKVTVKDGQISSMTYDAKKGADSAALITADAELNKGENKPSEIYPAVAKSFTDAGEDIAQMLSPSGGGEQTKTFGKLMTPLLVSMISGGEQKITASRFVDGVYKAQFKDFDADGWKEAVTLSIRNGEVTVKEFYAISKADEKKRITDDAELNAKWKEADGTDWKTASDALVESFKKSGNDVTKVDNVAGATIASNNFKLLVGQILMTTALEGDNKEVLQIDRYTPAA